MSPASTSHYYDGIVEGVDEARGGHTSAPVIVYSVNFAEVKRLIDADRWEAAGELLASRAQRLQAAGAEVVLLATNTMHRVADTIASALAVPFVHIVDPTAAAIHEAGLDTVAVLGTETTMAGEFYHERFAAHGVETVVPDGSARETVDRVIFEELVHGEVRDASRHRLLAIVADIREAGAEGVVLGCTELAMLLDHDDTDLPVFDTTSRHVSRAVQLCLGETPLPGE